MLNGWLDRVLKNVSTAWLYAFLMTVFLVLGFVVQPVVAQTAPDKFPSGIILLLLDGSGASSDDLPIADAGEDIVALVADIVVLDGSGSSSENMPLTYAWLLTDVPAGSAATLSSSSVVAPELLIDQPGVYVAQLIVNDGDNDSEPDVVTITTMNRAPIAVAGDDVQTIPGELVTFNGAASSDLDGDAITYSWAISSAPDGSSAALSDTSAISPTFTPVLKGAYVIELIVNDGLLDSAADTLQVDVGIDLTLSIEDVFIGVGRETTATIALNQPAPVGGISLNMTVDAPVVSLGSTTITYAEGETQQDVVLTGLEAGLSTLRVSGTNIDEVSAEIEVSQALISMGDIDVIAPSESTSVAISISDPAPAGGVTINLQTLDTSVATVTPATLFIAEGTSTPAANAQVTGVGFGTTSLKATTAGFAPDSRDVVVALMASFDPTSLSVPELQERTIVLRLDAPAPTGGVNFDLSLVKQDSADPLVFSIPEEVSIAEGQTQSPPIVVNGLVEGVATLRAGAPSFVDSDAVVTVVDAPDVFLRSTSGARVSEAVVGVDLQRPQRIGLQTTPPTPVDIRVTVPEESGVLLSGSSVLSGQTELVFEDVLSTFSPVFYIQGTDLGDDVPVSIVVFEANTTNLAGYESIAATVDVDPSGVYMSTGNFTTNSFASNRNILVRASVLYDDETPVRSGERLTDQSVRGGFDIEVAMTVDDSGVVALASGSTDLLTIQGGQISGQISADLIAEGVATISIVAQPQPDFSLPTNQTDDVVITLETPEAYLRSSGSFHLQEAIIGVDLQGAFRISMEASPPVPVDILLSVGASDGVLFSSSATVAGSHQLLIEDVASSISPFFYIQGTVIGDDVPISIDIFEANTTAPVGFTVLASTVDIDPSGVYMTSGDYNTTIFSSARPVIVTSGYLYDDETPDRVGDLRATQGVRGGLSLSVPMQISDTMVAVLEADGANNLIIAGATNNGRLDVFPVGGGTATVSITTQPLPGFSLPADRTDSLQVTVDAPEAFLRSTGGTGHLSEAVVGIDLQSAYRIGLESAPPSAVDIRVTVADSTGVLLTDSATAIGTTEILIEDVASTFTPVFYIQGTAIGDDVDLSIEVFDANTTNLAGYTALASTVDVDPSGVYIGTSDFDITTFSPNRSITAFSVLIWDDEASASQIGRSRANQIVRGGQELSVSLQTNAVNVVALPAGATDILTITGGSSSGAIEADPLTAGVATISITAQPGPEFVLPINTDGEVVITVDAPEVRLQSGATIFIGDELQRSFDVSLEVAPPNPVDVSVQVVSSAVALVSQNALIAGTQNTVFGNADTTSVGSIFLQGLQLDGATQVRISAPGYQDSVTDVEVVKSGFRLTGSVNDVAVGQARDFRVQSGRLNDNNTYAESQQVRPDAGISVDVISSMPAIGTVTTPVNMTPDSTFSLTTFIALSAGSTEISITQPTGFTEPAGATELDLTVTP